MGELQPHLYRGIRACSPRTVRRNGVPASDEDIVSGFVMSHARIIFAAETQIEAIAMRLGQMSRKLGISQGEIVRFLSEQNLSVEEGSNVKLDESRVRLLYARYAPEEVYPHQQVADESPTPVVSTKSTDSALLSNETGEGSISVAADENDSIVHPKPAEVDAQPVVFVSSEPQTAPAENSPTGEAEVIRAPKVELAGLKVIGKIELPSPKKKEVPESDSSVTLLESPESSVGGEEGGSAKATHMETTPRRDDARGPRDGRRSDDARRSRRRNDREQRSPKNPIALQREKEMKEELERRKAKAAEEKERRTRNYNKRVKHSPPTKAVRLIEEPVEQLDTASMDSEPRGWFGRLIKWLRT